jgi:hypothetical protein
LTLGEIFASFKQGNVLDGLFALVNGQFKISREFGRYLLLGMDGLRNNNLSGSNG